MLIGLLSYSEDERWQEVELKPFGSDPNVRWAVHYEIHLFDIHTKNILDNSLWLRFKARHAEFLPTKYNPEGALGEIFGFTVCSPAFKKDPTKEYVEYIERALVQSKFNEALAIAYLKKRLDALGERPAAELMLCLRAFLETEEWGHEINGVSIKPQVMC